VARRCLGARPVLVPSLAHEPALSLLVGAPRIEIERPAVQAAGFVLVARPAPQS